MTFCGIRRSFVLHVAMLLAALAAADAYGQYPKINLAVGYRVDPKWPHKIEGRPWRYVTGAAVDARDQVWLVNQLAPQVQVFDKSGKFLGGWGEGYFKAPHFLRIDHDGNVWVADFKRHIVQKFSPDGERLLVLGTEDSAGNDASHFNGPTDIAIAENGDAFITDGYGNDRVVHFDREGKFIKSWGQRGVRAGELSQPHSIAIDSQGRLYVAERNNCRIQIFDTNGKSLGQWRNLVNPWGLCITPRDELYVCGSSPKRWTDAGNLGNPPTDQLVMKFDTDGKVLEHWTFPLATAGKLAPGEIDWVHAIAVDSQGNLYLGDVADESLEHRLQKFERLAAEQ